MTPMWACLFVIRLMSSFFIMCRIPEPERLGERVAECQAIDFTGGVLIWSVSLRFSAYLCVLCVYGCFNAEVAEVRREPQRKTESKKLLTKVHKGTNRPGWFFLALFLPRLWLVSGYGPGGTGGADW